MSVLEVLGLLALSGVVICFFSALGSLAVPNPRRRTEVPNFVGLDVRHTFQIALRAHLRTHVVRIEMDPAPEGGFVVSQHPEPGAEVWWDAVVTLIVEHPPR